MALPGLICECICGIIIEPCNAYLVLRNAVCCDQHPAGVNVQCKFGLLAMAMLLSLCWSVAFLLLVLPAQVCARIRLCWLVIRAEA